MTRLRLAVLGVLALTLVAPLAAAAPAGGNAMSVNGTANTTTTTQATPTDTPTPTQKGPKTLTSNPTEYTITDLTRRGTSHEGAPDSMRFLSEYGSATIRHSPVGPFSSSWEYLNPGETTVNRNKVTLRSVRLAPADQLEDKLKVHVVAWKKGQKTVVDGNKTVERPAAQNVTHRTHVVDLGRGYDNATVPIPANYQGNQKVTLWIDGYPDARWVFDHHSIAASQAAGIDSQGDLWYWAAQNILLVAVPGVLLSAVVSRKMVQQTAAGPMKGAMWWGIVGGLFLFGVALFGWFETTLLLSHIPQLFGAAIALVVFVAMLEVAGRKHNWVLFERHELEDAKNPLGDDVQDALFEELDEYRTVRHDDGSLRLVKPGIFPFLARFFADPAKLPEDVLKTQVELKGSKWQRKYVADPKAEGPVYWRAAHWSFRIPLFDEATHQTVNGEKEKLSLLDRFNPAFAIKAIGSLGVGYYFGTALSLPTLGVAAGVVPVIAMSIHANDGYVEFEPAPVHMRKSEATLAQAQEEYVGAETYVEADKDRWETKAAKVNDVREQVARRDATMSKELNRGTAGLDLDDGPGDGPKTNGTSPDDDDELLDIKPLKEASDD